MTRPIKPTSAVKITRLCIWSVRNQSWLAGQVRIYIFMVTAVIAFLALAGVISLQTAMLSSFCIGLIAVGLIWTLVQQRKSWLLNLREPELREQALTAMRTYIHEARSLGKMAGNDYAVRQDNSDQCVDCGIH